MEPEVRIALRTNFEDYYDDFLLGPKSPNRTYFRKADVLDKKLSLEFVRDNLGYVIPPIFKISDLNDSYIADNPEIMVFDKKDQYVKSTSSASREDANKYGMPLLYQKGNPVSYTMYRIGSREIHTRQESDHEYRSDLGNTKETILATWGSLPYVPYRPIYAVKFVEINGFKIAVQHQESPKLEDTVIAEEFSAEEIYNEVYNWFAQKGYE